MLFFCKTLCTCEYIMPRAGKKQRAFQLSQLWLSNVMNKTAKRNDDISMATKILKQHTHAAAN